MARWTSRRRSATIRFVVAGALAGLLALTSSSAFAQHISDQMTTEERNALFDALDRDYAVVEARSRLLKNVIRLVTPSVVHIEWKKTERSNRGTGRTREIEEAGSGVIIQMNDRHYVLTNWHVVRDAAQSAVNIHLSDGREIHPVGIWKDPDTDVALLSVPETDLVAARLGDSSSLETGDFVLAFGSPFGLSHSVTYGIISAKGRRELELGDEGLKFQDFIQTDAAINPGNSGGPLVNLKGEVVGINTAIASNSGGSEGIGFSIPINMVMAIVKQLITQGKVVRAFLGVTLDKRFTPSVARQLGVAPARGARIIRITPNSAAEQARMQVDDVILEFNHVPIEDDNHLVNVVSLTDVGTEVPVVIFRRGQEMTLRVKVGDRSTFEPQGQLAPPAEPPLSQLDPPSSLPAWHVDAYGLTVVEIDYQEQPNLDGYSTRRLMVAQVDPQGPASKKVHQGDVIERVNRVRIHTIADLEDTLSDTAVEDESLLVEIVGHRDPAPAARTARLLPGRDEGAH